MPRVGVCLGLLAALALGGCAGPGIRVHPAAGEWAPPAAPRGYMEALDELAPAAAAVLAQSAEQHTYAAALEVFLREDLAACEQALGALPGALDPELARRSAELRTLARLRAEDWSKLGEDGAGSPGVAEVAAAFRGGEPSRVSLAEARQEVPLTFSIAGIPTARFSINGHAHELVMDTGATFTALADTVAQASGVPPIGSVAARALVGSSGPGQAFDVRLAQVDTLDLGAVRGERLPVALFAQRDLQFRILWVPVITVEGIVGWNFLQRLDVMFDYAQARAIFFPTAPGDCEKNLIWYGHPLAIARTREGQPLLLAIDTGASRSYLTPRGAAKLHPGSAPRLGERVAAAFRLDDQEISFAGVSVRENTRAAAALDGVLGNDLFGLGTLTLRPQARCVHFRAAR